MAAGAESVTTATAGIAAGTTLPGWARTLVDLYESNAASQFIVYGNVYDRMLISGQPKPRLGTLTEFLTDVLMSRFDVVLSYDVGNGIRVERGGEIFTQWPYFKENQQLPKTPRAAVETLTLFFRYCANLARLKRESPQVGCIIKGADLVAPNVPNSSDYDLSAIATLIRDWSSDSLLSSHNLATFLLAENLSDLHPLITNNPRAAQIRIALPAPDELKSALDFVTPSYPTALKDCVSRIDAVAHQMAGATLGAIENMLK